MSPQSQNEFVVLLGEEIQQIISEKVRKSGYCSVMADTTPDVSHTDRSIIGGGTICRSRFSESRRALDLH